MLRRSHIVNEKKNSAQFGHSVKSYGLPVFFGNPLFNFLSNCRYSITLYHIDIERTPIIYKQTSDSRPSASNLSSELMRQIQTMKISAIMIFHS